MEGEEVKLFQFPLHRDPRCNMNLAIVMAVLNESFSSLYIGILAATEQSQRGENKKSFQFPLHRDPRCNRTYLPGPARPGSFSSLYIGILAATLEISFTAMNLRVSVPFTSGSSLQQRPNDKALTLF